MEKLLQKCINKKILIFTDAYHPQVNGVVETIDNFKKTCEKYKLEVIIIHPKFFKFNFSLPTYSEIKLAFPRKKIISQIIQKNKPDYIHIATEGPIGSKTAKVCIKNNLEYTTAYHTNFPEYINKRFSFINEDYIYNYIKKIHLSAKYIFVTTQSMKEKLINKGFSKEKLIIWERGIDLDRFNWKKTKNNGKKFLYVGRISIEKNLDVLLNLAIENKYDLTLVGKGPELNKLKKKYLKHPNILFKGEKRGNDLVNEYKNADIFVFPSKTETFGIVQIEAIACGLPVAAYDVIGPKDIIKKNINGYFSQDLNYSIQKCINIDSEKCSLSVKHMNWDNINKSFLEYM